MRPVDPRDRARPPAPLYIVCRTTPSSSSAAEPTDPEPIAASPDGHEPSPDGHGSFARADRAPSDGRDAPFGELVERAQADDERAFEVIWRTYNPRLVRYLWVMAGSGDAEDLAAVTWAEVARSLDRFRGGPEDFRAWIFSIARLRMLDLRRMQARRPPPAADEPADAAEPGSDPADITDRREATDRALALVATLPRDQADIVLLRVVAGLDVATVAELVGKQPGTVRVALHRALKKLAAQVALGVEGDTDRNGAWSDGA